MTHTCTHIHTKNKLLITHTYTQWVSKINTKVEREREREKIVTQFSFGKQEVKENIVPKKVLHSHQKEQYSRTITTLNCEYVFNYDIIFRNDSLVKK